MFFLNQSLPLSLPLQDKFVKRCKCITEKISEEMTEVEGERLTIPDMEQLKFTECLEVSLRRCHRAVVDRTVFTLQIHVQV